MKCYALFLLFYSLNALSQINTAKTLGFAGVGSVNAESTNSSLLQNPAALSLNADLEFGGGYGYGEAPLGIKQKNYYAWSKDSLSSSFKTRRNNRVKSFMNSGQESFPFAAAVYFSNYERNFEKYKFYKLAFSRIITKKISFGGALNYLDGKPKNVHLDKWVGDLGLVYRRSKTVHLGVSWLNLNSSNNMMKKLRFGGAFGRPNLARIFLDTEYNLESISNKWSFGFGFEAKVRKFFAFRSGFFTSAGGIKDYLGLGVSFMGPKFKLHYGTKTKMKSKVALHSVDFSLPLW